ncbi:MAG: GGDEF domain-containing protein, partial [Halioglobus sp.]|nr:GGDEF domain-containing protein [Halioglobus sp.]
MELIEAQTWAVIHIGLILLVTTALMACVYVLVDSSNPTPALGLFAVYFMAALLGWIAFTLQQVADIPMPLDVASVAAIINSYILFLAVGQRSGHGAGRIVLGAITLSACLSAFFLDKPGMFIVQTACAGLLFGCTGVLAAIRGWQRNNAGDGMLAVATLIMVFGVPTSLYYLLTRQQPDTAQAIAFGTHSITYVLVGFAFLTSVLVDYQKNLSHLTTEDPLTQLLNRRGLESTLQVTLAHAARQQLTTSAIMLDIDGIREINSNFGPETGDQVIRAISRQLQYLSRASDVVARVGGDDFLLVLPQTPLDAARTLAERI